MRASVCVALPVKDGERYLAEAIESVLAQEGVELELAVYDNGSSDGSVRLARRYAGGDPRVSVTVNERDLHFYGSLNRGLRETGCRYFVPFACDDLMLPGNLARKVEALERTGAGFAHSTAYTIDEAGAVTGFLYQHEGKPELTPAPHHFPQVAPVNSVSCQSVVARVESLRAVGGFDARTLYCADWLAWMLLSLRHDVVTLPQPLVANRVHSESGTSTYNRTGRSGFDIPATLDYVLRSGALPLEWAAMRDQMLAASLLHIAEHLDRSGVRRAGGGCFAAYTLVGRALALAPTGGFGWYHALVTAAGLVAPSVPFDVVAGTEDLDGLFAECEALRRVGLLGSLALGSTDVERELALIEAALAPYPALDVDLVGIESLEQLFTPGRLTVAPFGSETIDRAEAAGLPVRPFAFPDPFAEEPDPARSLRLERFAA